MTDKLRELTLLALESHGCERLKDFYECGPVQRAAVETFLEAALAQQDAQAVPQGWKLVPVEPTPEMVEAAKGGATLNPNMAALWYKGLIVNWHSMLNAAPTPPAQRVMLTDEEIRDLWSWSMTAEAERTANTQQHAFAQGVIEAYERKNGISQPGYTAPDMASQGASQFRAGHDAAQSEIAELEQENRLLRARNDRLQKEIEQKGER